MNKKYLYSPWRLDYILSEKCDGCMFCCKPEAKDDTKHLIVHRSKYCYVIVNLFPYNNGHVMVVPYKHVPTLSELPRTVLNDLFATVQLAESVLCETYRCEGMNIGINIGKAGGAGVDDHIHVHLVPRWNGDCNFMTTVGGERVIPEAFDAAWKKLKTGFTKHKNKD
jgi:ATP adenylyltransferase